MLLNCAFLGSRFERNGGRRVQRAPSFAEAMEGREERKQKGAPFESPPGTKWGTSYNGAVKKKMSCL